MILNIGYDLVEIDRLESALERHGSAFLKRVLTPREEQQFRKLRSPRRRAEWLAGRFAAKEAASKALSTGVSGAAGPGFHDLEVVPGPHGEPRMVVSQSVVERFVRPVEFHLSITHTGSTAGAVVVVEDRGQQAVQNRTSCAEIQRWACPAGKL